MTFDPCIKFIFVIAIPIVSYLSRQQRELFLILDLVVRYHPGCEKQKIVTKTNKIAIRTNNQSINNKANVSDTTT